MNTASVIEAHDSMGWIIMPNTSLNLKHNDNLKIDIDSADPVESISDEKLQMGIMVTKEILASVTYQKDLDKCIVELKQGKLVARPRRTK